MLSLFNRLRMMMLKKNKNIVIVDGKRYVVGEKKIISAKGDKIRLVTFKI